MKRIFCLMTVLLLIMPIESFARGFIKGFEDVPLMDGLKQESNHNFSFGNEESGYTETLLSAKTKNLKFSRVKFFYKDVLPKLGWSLAKESNAGLKFSREEDILEISQRGCKPLKVLIMLKSEN